MERVFTEVRHKTNVKKATDWEMLLEHISDLYQDWEGRKVILPEPLL